MKNKEMKNKETKNKELKNKELKDKISERQKQINEMKWKTNQQVSRPQKWLNGGLPGQCCTALFWRLLVKLLEYHCPTFVNDSIDCTKGMSTLWIGTACVDSVDILQRKVWWFLSHRLQIWCVSWKYKFYISKVACELEVFEINNRRVGDSIRWVAVWYIRFFWKINWNAPGFAGSPVRRSPVRRFAGSPVRRSPPTTLCWRYYLLYSYWPDASRAVRCGPKPATFSL